MKCVAIIQARTSSSRLTGKALEPLQGLPVIVFLLRRVAHAKELDHFLVSTNLDERFAGNWIALPQSNEAESKL